MTVRINREAVTSYLKELEATLGTEQFRKSYTAIQMDKAMKCRELISLARLFSLEPVRSKKQALKVIWHRHSSLLLSREKLEEINERAAA